MASVLSGVRRSAVLILTFNIFFTCSQILHEFVTVLGCFENGATELIEQIDGEELVYLDLDRTELVVTVPPSVVPNPAAFSHRIPMHELTKAIKLCPAALTFCKAEEKGAEENKKPPESVIYPAEDVQLGVENSLICFVNKFFPPHVEVNWSKNGHPVSEGVSLSRYYFDDDQSFYQFSTLTFTPSEGDVYSCTVEHMALERPKTRTWEAAFTHQSPALDVVCGVGLTLGLLGVAVGTFLFVKGHHGD